MQIISYKLLDSFSPNFLHKALHYYIYFDYSVAPETDPCGLTKPIVFDSQMFGNITSKNYPSSYDNNLDCEWHIHVDDGYYVQLTFPEFDVEEK